MNATRIKNKIKLLPRWIKDPLLQARSFARWLPYRGTGRVCPVCGNSSRKFESFGSPLRADAKCMFCGALERHRFVWRYFESETNLFNGEQKKVLHVAPENCFEPRLRKRLGSNYITADLLDPQAMIRMDITDIQFPDNYFDVIYCSHVFEHVPDDRKAMREFFRTLKPNGWAILLVPITVEKTFEDPSIVNPSERLRIFGQVDHVRRYGSDYIDRLKESGFNVKMSYATDLFQKNEIKIAGLSTASGAIYYCTK